MRFLRTIQTTSFIALFLIGFVVYRFWIVTAKDHESYQALLLSTDPGQKMRQSALQVATQVRKGIEKNAWYSKEFERLQFYLTARESELTLLDKEGRSEIVEHLVDVQSAMQEEILYLTKDDRRGRRQHNGKIMVPGRKGAVSSQCFDERSDELKIAQVFRTIETPTATYDFQKNIFCTESVLLRRFREGGTELPRDTSCYHPLMQIDADTMEFSFLQQNPDFKAKHLKMKVFAQ